MITQIIENTLTQKYSNFELIIVDDGSTDDTENVVRKFLSDKVYYYKKANAERGTARNFGTAKAKGDYLNWFDSDDIMFPDHLQQAVKAITQYHTPEFLSLGFQYQDESGKVMHRSDYSQDVNNDLYKGNQFAVDSIFVRKDIAIANPFNEDRELSGSEDYELWLRLAARYHIYTSPAITVGFIHHSERSTIVMSDPDQLIRRFTKFIHYTTSNAEVITLLGKHKGYFIMKNYLLLAVDLTINNHRRLGLQYLKQAFFISPKVIFERGLYAFIKHFIRHSLS